MVLFLASRVAADAVFRLVINTGTYLLVNACTVFGHIVALRFDRNAPLFGVP
jgi:hypothetical protein